MTTINIAIITRFSHPHKIFTDACLFLNNIVNLSSEISNPRNPRYSCIPHWQKCWLMLMCYYFCGFLNDYLRTVLQDVRPGKLWELGESTVINAEMKMFIKYPEIFITSFNNPTFALWVRTKFQYIHFSSKCLRSGLYSLMVSYSWNFVFPNKKFLLT